MYDDEAQNYNNFLAIYAMVQYDDAWNKAPLLEY